MSSAMTEEDQRTLYKRQAAERAVDFIESGTVVGLGTGSTAIWAVRRVGERLREGGLHAIVAIPTSVRTEEAMRALRIPLTTLEEHPVIDVTIDGADEVDPDLRLIKGGGGALLHEKIVAQGSRREIIVVDDSKPSPVLGSKHALPVEVIPFGWLPEARFVESLGGTPSLRRDPDGAPFHTDQENFILDCAFGPIAGPEGLVDRLHARAGVVEVGLFIGMSTDLIVAGSGGIEHRTRRTAGSSTPPVTRR